MRKAPKLMFIQTSMTANFCAACDYPKESFAQVTARLLGTKGFPQTENAESLKRESRMVFNLGRQR